MARSGRARGSAIYSKPALSHGALLERWESRGLIVPDRARAERYLRHIGYFRLSPYTIPMQIPQSEHQFRVDTEFDDVLRLYVFDRSLRLLVIDALERVEVAVRSALTDHMSTQHGGPHWWVDRRHFRDDALHEGLVNLVRATCNEQLRRHPETDADPMVFRSALEHYLTTYGSPELPPSWLMVETLTIGQLANLIRNLASRRDKTSIANSVGINATLLDSWMRTYVRVRNVCAHHGRLWNVGLGVYPMLPTSSRVAWLEDAAVIAEHPSRARRLYPVLVSLQSILTTVSPGSTWARRLSELLQASPHVPLAAMGIPHDWRSDPFWAARVAT